MASGIYDIFKYGCFAGEHDMEEDSPSDVIKVALMNNDHSFVSTHNLWSQVSANELPATGNYSTGGEIFVSQDITKLATTKFDAEDIEWPNATFTCYHAVMYNATTGRLIASIDFGGAKTMVVGTFRIEWNAAGIMTLATAS